MNIVIGKMFAVSGLFIAASLHANQCYAGDVASPRAQSVQRLFECKAITDGAARLACFDAAAESLEIAERQGDIVMVERARVLESRRALFGFTLPDVTSLLGTDADQLDAVETTLERASNTSGAGWTFHLADGSIWRQIDNTRLDFRATAGLTVKIRRGAMGTYFLKVADNPAVRAKRQ